MCILSLSRKYNGQNLLGFLYFYWTCTVCIFMKSKQRKSLTMISLVLICDVIPCSGEYSFVHFIIVLHV